MEPEDHVPARMNRYPPADISPTEFEEFVAELFSDLPSEIKHLQVKTHDRVESPDGTYEFDATVRYEWRGLWFIVIIEAKRHAGSIKREHVQVLHQKVLSVGAQKGVMFATSGFQSGALEFAKAHGIALVSVTEGRFTYETKASVPPPTLTREEAAERFGLPTFVGHAYTAGESVDSTRITLISPKYADYVVESLLPSPDAGPG